MADEDTLKKLYKLSANPFSQRSNPSAPLAGRKLESGAWTSIVETAIGQRGSSLNFIEGDYGLGKTHSLYQIQRLCDQREDVACVFLKLMMEDPVKNFGFDFIRRVFKHLPASVLAKLARAKATGSLRQEHLPHFNVIAKFAAKTSPYYELIIGGMATAAEIKKANIRRPPKTAEDMFEYLVVLLVMLKGAGVKTLVLLVDEAEYIFSQLNERKSALVFNAIRSIYDLPDTPNLGLGYDTANVVFFFAISTAGAGTLTRLEKVEAHQGGPIQPLMSRKGQVISLTFLNREETRELVTEYLHTDRVTGKRSADPLIPYDAGFVDYVHQLTKGHPRKIVERCDYVLTEGVRDRAPILTKQYAKQVFERLGLEA